MLPCDHIIIVSGGTAYQGTIGYILLAEKLALPTKCDLTEIEDVMHFA